MEGAVYADRKVLQGSALVQVECIGRGFIHFARIAVSFERYQAWCAESKRGAEGTRSGPIEQSTEPGFALVYGVIRRAVGVLIIDEGIILVPKYSFRNSPIRISQ